MYSIMLCRVKLRSISISNFHDDASKNSLKKFKKSLVEIRESRSKTMFVFKCTTSYIFVYFSRIFSFTKLTTTFLFCYKYDTSLYKYESDIVANLNFIADYKRKVVVMISFLFLDPKMIALRKYFEYCWYRRWKIFTGIFNYSIKYRSLSEIFFSHALSNNFANFNPNKIKI
jgi:hypothetical protein